MSENARIRIDKWLWQARFFKTRSLAATRCRSKSVRLNGVHVSKASQQVAPGDVLTFQQARDTRVVRILALGERRGPASEAVTLFEDLAPPEQEKRLKTDKPPVQGARQPGSGRPTKAERRALDRLLFKNE